jgi:hypothetical protein
MGNTICKGGKPGKDKPEYRCRKCGKTAAKSKRLCKPESL